MAWHWILTTWTALAAVWWILAYALAATARPRRHPEPGDELDPRRLTIFKPLASPLGTAELEHLGRCLESYVAELDGESELLIGCHERERTELETFVERMAERYPGAEVRLVVHPDPSGCCDNPKVSWMLLLAPHATGELWLWSDSDIEAPPGTLRSLRADFADPGVSFLTSPYVIRRVTSATELLDTLFVNAEFYPGTVLLGRLGLIRFGFGSGMLFEAEAFRSKIDWDFLGSCLAEDFHLGRLLGPAGLGSMRVSTTPASGDFWKALFHYLRWQKTIRWCRPGSYAAQAVVMPVVGWLAAVALMPGEPTAWLGLGAALALDSAAALAICRALACSLGWRRVPLVPLWSLLRALTWIACWLPWPVVWRGRKWWSPHQRTQVGAEVRQATVAEVGSFEVEAVKSRSPAGLDGST